MGDGTANVGCITKILGILTGEMMRTVYISLRSICQMAVTCMLLHTALTFMMG